MFALYANLLTECVCPKKDDSMTLGGSSAGASY